MANILKNLGILKPKDTFDDVATNDLGKFAESMKNRFHGFFSDLDDLDFYGLSPNKKRWFVCDKKTGIISSHHWHVDQDKEECYKKFMNDHDPDEFLYRLETAKSPLILRTNEPHTKLEEVMYLHDVIAEIRGNHDFLLCVLQNARWADKTDWRLHMNPDAKTLVTFRTHVFRAPAETYPDNTFDWSLRHPDFDKWSLILNYVFEEAGIDLLTKNPTKISLI